MSRCRAWPPRTVRSPPAIAAANAQVPGDDPVGDGRVLAPARSGSTPCTVERRGGDALDLGAHLDEHLAEVDDLRLAGDVVDDRRTLGQHRAISRFSVAPTLGKSSQRFAPRSRSAHLGDHEAVLDAHLRAELGAARSCACPGRASRCCRRRGAPPGPAAAGDQRTQHADRGAQPADQVVGRLVPELVRARRWSPCRSGCRRPAAGRGCSTATVHPSSSSSRAITCTSRMSGTLVIGVRPRASRAAAISFRALFFAPPTCAVPRSGCDSGPSDRTWNPCIRPMLVLRLRPARTPRVLAGPWSTSPASTPAPATPARPASAT